jgi:hypothetical protein
MWSGMQIAEIEQKNGQKKVAMRRRHTKYSDITTSKSISISQRLYCNCSGTCVSNFPSTNALFKLSNTALSIFACKSYKSASS